MCAGLGLPSWLPASTQVRKAPLPRTGLEGQREDRVPVCSPRLLQGAYGKGVSQVLGICAYMEVRPAQNPNNGQGSGFEALVQTLN